jgi:hypothetical protein
MELFRVVALAGAVAGLCVSGAGAVSLNGNTVKHVVAFDITNADLSEWDWSRSWAALALPNADPTRKLRAASFRADYRFSGSQIVSAEEVLYLMNASDGEDIFDHSLLFLQFGGFPDLEVEFYDHVAFWNEMYVFYRGAEQCFWEENLDGDGNVKPECVESYAYSFEDAFEGSTGWLMADDPGAYAWPGIVPLLFGIDWMTNSYSFVDFRLTGTATVVYDYAPIPLPAGLPLLLAGLASGAVLLRPWRRAQIRIRQGRRGR